jgi:hypothetical protein
MIILKRKIFFILIILILIAFSLMLLLIISLTKDIRKNSEEFLLKRKALASMEREFQEFENFERNSAFYQSNLEKLDNLFLNPEVPIDFIQFLEEESGNLGLLIKIFPSIVTSRETDPWESIGFQILLTGSFPNSLKFLEKLQTSPWLLEIQRTEVQRISEKELQSEELKDFSLGDVFFSIILKIYTKEK